MIIQGDQQIAAKQGDSGELEVKVNGSLPVARGTTDDGTTLMPIKVDPNGKILFGNTTELAVYSASNIPSDNVSGDFEIRDANAHSYYIPHRSDGIMEQSLAIKNDLDQALKLHIWLALQFELSYVQQACYIWTYTDHSTIPAGGRFIFAPEKGMHVNNNANPDRQIFALPELRQPHWAFAAYVQAVDTPTSGQVVLSMVRTS